MMQHRYIDLEPFDIPAAYIVGGVLGSVWSENMHCSLVEPICSGSEGHSKAQGNVGSCMVI
jgi:hypothetical protein